MTDVKGRPRSVSVQQADPDLFLHVVERTADGVYVTGAKAHQNRLSEQPLRSRHADHFHA